MPFGDVDGEHACRVVVDDELRLCELAGAVVDEDEDAIVRPVRGREIGCAVAVEIAGRDDAVGVRDGERLRERVRGIGVLTQGDVQQRVDLLERVVLVLRGQFRDVGLASLSKSAAALAWPAKPHIDAENVPLPAPCSAAGEVPGKYQRSR